MRKLRSCDSAQLNTGVSKCPANFGKKKMAIIVPPGTKLPKEITREVLEKLAHGEPHERIYGVGIFVEYAKNGGDVQTAVNGYGPEEQTGISALKETFTLQKFVPEIHASFVRVGGREWGAYFVDEDSVLYGLDDGTGILAPVDMSTIYTDATPSPTSSAAAGMTITFAYKDVVVAYRDYDFLQLDFNPAKCLLGLTPVRLEKTDEGNYKIYEKIGGYDVTPIYGPLIAQAGKDVFATTITAVTYNEATKDLAISGATDDAKILLQSPSVLFENDITGIEQVV